MAIRLHHCLFLAQGKNSGGTGEVGREPEEAYGIVNGVWSSEILN